MTTHLLFFGSVIVSAIVMALLEIQVEGPDGWAADLPTWRVQNRWTKIFYSGRPLTGYHLYLQLFVLLFVHLPFLLSLSAWTLRAECRVLSFMIFFWIVEDFTWFVINPAFGIRKFRKEHIWWHAPHWLFICPRDYVIFLPVGTVLYVLSFG